MRWPLSFVFEAFTPGAFEGGALLGSSVFIGPALAGELAMSVALNRFVIRTGAGFTVLPH